MPLLGALLTDSFSQLKPLVPRPQELLQVACRMRELVRGAATTDRQHPGGLSPQLVRVLSFVMLRHSSAWIRHATICRVSCIRSDGVRRPECPCRLQTLLREFKDTLYPFFELDTLFLECLFVLFLFV